MSNPEPGGHTAHDALLAMGLLSLVSLFFGGWGVLGGLQTLNWTKTPAQLLEVQTGTGTHGRTGLANYLTVRYQYRAASQDHESVRYGMGTGKLFYRKESLRTEIQRLREARNWIAYYNPENPQESVLIRGVAGFDLGLFLAGLGGLAGTIVTGIRRRRNTQP